jgi:hypothetical protein
MIPKGRGPSERKGIGQASKVKRQEKRRAHQKNGTLALVQSDQILGVSVKQCAGRVTRNWPCVDDPLTTSVLF